MMPQYNSAQHQQQDPSNSIQMQQQQQQKPAKVTKVRRTRQPRNPQLSVARRNERERNRVKMVNNGFALLREHLPVEDLQRCEQAASPDGSSHAADTGKGSTKAKKFSKVETLRAAIQRIKMLEELIRSADAEFESMNIVPSNGSLSSSQMAAYDEEPLSVCEPLSCGSTSSTTMHLDISGQQQAQQHQQQQITFQQPEQFIKLEPSHHPQQQQLINTNMPSPQDSQTSSSAASQHQYLHQTQVQHTFSPSQQQTQQTQQTQQLQLQVEPNSLHTQLWIQQHQNSFMEQQQVQYQQQQQQQQQWYSVQEQQQQQQQQWYSVQEQQQAHQSDSVVQVETGSWYAHSETPTSQATTPLAADQALSQVEQKVWFTDSPGAASSQSPQQIVFNHHRLQQAQPHHQISLYSQ